MSDSNSLPQLIKCHQDSFTTGQFSDRHFTENKCPTETFPTDTSQMDISANRHFPERTFPRRKRIFKFLHFSAKLFVKTNALDFPLIFSWFIILTTYFIYTHVIYKRFNLLSIASHVLLLFSLRSAMMCTNADLKISLHLCVPKIAITLWKFHIPNL